jgi:hypothetical protein
MGAGVGRWKVGTDADVTARFIDDEGEIITGTATVKITRRNPTVEYLQSDLTTWGATPVSHAASYIAAVGWTLVLDVPLSADGFYVTAELTHSDPDVVPWIETNFVTQQDEDDVEVQQAPVEPALVFED